MHMRSRFSLAVLVATAAAVISMSVTRSAPRLHVRQSRPNVVLISVDTTRADHLSCYGYPKQTTPNLDGLAGRGVRYALAGSQAPWTLGSHMSLFTSLVPSHCRMNHPLAVLPAEIPTL